MFNLDFLFLMVGFATKYSNSDFQPSLHSSKKLFNLTSPQGELGAWLKVS